MAQHLKKVSEKSDGLAQSETVSSNIISEPGVADATSFIASVHETVNHAATMDRGDAFKNPIRETAISQFGAPINHDVLPTKTQRIKWLFFDCDNTLVLSETLAFQASFSLVNEVLAHKGVDHEYVADEILVHFMGLSFKGMCLQMAQEFGFEWTEDDKTHFAAREEEEVINIFEKDLTAVPGIFNVLVQIVRSKKYNIAVVSSSSTKRIISCLKKTNLDMFFLPQYIFSAADSLPSPAIKPDPAIYSHAMKELGVKAEDCVCIEDSRVGVRAAVEAGVPCIGFLQSYNGRSKQDQLVIDFQKDGVVDIMWEWNDFFDILDKIENK